MTSPEHIHTNAENGWPIDPRFPSGKLGLFFDEEVQRLIDSFAYCFKVKITIFSARMEEMIVYHCYAGLSEIVVPIRIEGKLVGYGLLGQFRTDQGLPEDIIQAWEKAGFASGEFREAYEAQPFFGKPALDNMIRLFSMMIAFIVTREYIRLRQPGVTEQVIHWLDEHIAEPLSLDDAAGAVKYSRSTISHTIKRQLGMSFKEICILKKIQRFESIIAAEPAMSIQEAAAMVGYDDPFYFSRIYKKVRLAAPSSYINSVRKQTHN